MIINKRPSSLKFKFYLWRTLWGSIVTLMAFINIQQMFDNGQNRMWDKIGDPSEPRGSYGFFLLSVCCITDMIIMLKVKSLFNKQIVLHHAIMITLIILASLIRISHAPCIEFFMSTEIVTFSCWMAYFAENWSASDRHKFHRLYLSIYGLLTMMWRFPVWGYLMYSVMTYSRAHYQCFVGILPLFFLDIFWMYETVIGIGIGIRKPFNQKKIE